MSTEISVTDEAAVQSAVADVRSDTSDTNYLVCGHVDGNPNLIEFRTSGCDTTEIASLMDNGEVLYCLARYSSTFEMSTVTKFVFIHWIGESVSPVKKGRFGSVYGNVLKVFDCGHHLTIETSSTEDLDKDKIIQSLNDSMGTSNKVLDNAEASTRQMRGFTQTQLPQKDARRQFNVASVASKGHAIEVLPEVYDAVAKVRSDTEPEIWVVAGYRDNNPKGPLAIIGSGSGSLEDLKSCLSDVGVMYCLYKVVLTNDDSISVVKFVYISWVGESVKPMTKAKVSTHKGMTDEIFTPAHATIFATTLSDIDEGIIMDKVHNNTS